MTTTTRKKKKYYNEAARTKILKRINELVGGKTKGPLEFDGDGSRWKRAAATLNREFGDGETGDGWRTRFMRWDRAKYNIRDRSWGAQIQSEYRSRGLTLEQLGAEVGLTARTLSDRIRAVTPWKPDERRRLEEWLGQDNQGRAVNRQLPLGGDPPPNRGHGRLSDGTTFGTVGGGDLPVDLSEVDMTPSGSKLVVPMTVDVQAAVKILGDEWGQHRRRGRNWIDPKVIPMALSCLTGNPVGHYYRDEEVPNDTRNNP